MPVGFYANFLWVFKWLAHVLMEPDQKLQVNQIHNLGKKVLLLIRSLSRGGQHGRVGADCRLHPLIHTSAPSESSTKYRSSVSRDKVWIKVETVEKP